MSNVDLAGTSFMTRCALSLAGQTLARETNVHSQELWLDETIIRTGDVNNVCRMCKGGGGGKVQTNRSRYEASIHSVGVSWGITIMIF